MLRAWSSSAPDTLLLTHCAPRISSALKPSTLRPRRSIKRS
nr:MAG TPA_asm: hypothetical protein [Caudoviricetes sp.]